MTARRQIHIDLDLPELTPAQADCLWHFLEDLATNLWDAYECDLLDLEDRRSRLHQPEIDWTPADRDDLLEDDPAAAVNSDETDPDF